MSSSNQCKNCDRDRDLNNNYVNYNNGAYFTTNQNTNNRNAPTNNTNNAMNNNNNNNSTSNTAVATKQQQPKITAKVMFGSCSAIKELREKEQAEKNRSTQAGRRQ
ncbi:unnamed protein product [Diamesa hyperborea]